MSCRKQGMLTQGPAPDPKCKLNISSFLTHQHLLHCLISTRNSVSMVLLLWMMGGEGGWFISGSGWENRGWVLSLFFFIVICVFVFWSLMSCLFFGWVEHDSCCLCFFVYYLFSLSPVWLTRSYWGIEIVVSIMLQYL